MMRWTALLLLACSAAATKAQVPDRQFWVDAVPSWRLGTRTGDELEFSLRTARGGAAPTQYWATNTVEWAATPWLGLTAVGTLVESRGAAPGTDFFESRLSAGARMMWHRPRLRVIEYLRLEHRMLRPVGEVPFTIERARHREQVIVALNRASLSEARTIYFLSDAEWFLVHNSHGGWTSNQLRLRAGLGYRLNAHRSFELILNDTQHRGSITPAFEDADHVLRIRWREAL